jgi:CHAT domain-containing protein
VRVSELKTEIEERERRLYTLDSEIRRQNPRYAALTQPEAWGLGEIQADLLDGGTALLEYVLGRDRSYLFVVVDDGFEAFPLPPRAEIETMVRELRDAILDPKMGSYPHGYELYQALVDCELEVEGRARRVAEMIEGKRLLIVADGVLHYLPFGLLLTERPEPAASFTALPYLVRRHAVVYAPSASVAGLLKREYRGRPKAEGFVAFADPEVPKKKTEEQKQPVILQAALKHVRSEKPLTRLPYTRHEVSHIAALFESDASLGEVEEGRSDRYDGERVSLRLGREATKEAVFARFNPNSDPPGTGFVHLSTHGLLDEEKPEFSGLVFSPGAAQDPFWHTFEIFNARISADLVVLSACETGLGKVVSGEGIVGLARAFMYAGTPSVCVSLWKVQDRPTADFMEALYRLLLCGHHEDGTPLDKSEALRQAQLEAIELGGATAHPNVWAAFILLGEWR